MTTQQAAGAPRGGERIFRAIEAFQAGNDRDGNFRVVFDAYYRPVQRFFARKGLAPEHCLDLTQETFLGIYRGLETYRPEFRFETWLYKVATTTYLKSLRSRSASKRSGEEVSTEEAGVGTTLAVAGGQLDAVVKDEDRQQLRDAVAELPEKMRRCLTLRIYQERSYREIAAVLQVSVQTVKAHLHQGRQRLQERLGNTGSRRPGSRRPGSRAGPDQAAKKGSRS